MISVFPVKTPNVQRPTSNLQRRIIDLAFNTGDQRLAATDCRLEIHKFPPTANQVFSE
jgi:hypothetical protein